MLLHGKDKTVHLVLKNIKDKYIEYKKVCKQIYKNYTESNQTFI